MQMLNGAANVHNSPFHLHNSPQLNNHFLVLAGLSPLGCPHSLAPIFTCDDFTGIVAAALML